MQNAHTSIYWREYDIVMVKISGLHIGILDGWFSWPIQRHVNPRMFDPEDMMWWPVRVGKLTHRFFALDHIIENKTLLIHVRRIQRCWRTKMKMRNAAAIVIQQMFRNCISNPYHPLCRSRMDREYSCMAQELYYR
jgi:hypothetical protein